LGCYYLDIEILYVKEGAASVFEFDLFVRSEAADQRTARLRASMQPGAQSFRRALAHILTAAAERLEPEATPGSVASEPACALY
jgi:hypothetical protein